MKRHIARKCGSEVLVNPRVKNPTLGGWQQRWLTSILKNHSAVEGGEGWGAAESESIAVECRFFLSCKESVL